jgi:hypothetical protein
VSTARGAGNPTGDAVRCALSRKGVGTAAEGGGTAEGAARAARWGGRGPRGSGRDWGARAGEVAGAAAARGGAGLGGDPRACFAGDPPGCRARGTLRGGRPASVQIKAFRREGRRLSPGCARSLAAPQPSSRMGARGAEGGVKRKFPVFIASGRGGSRD